MQKVKLELQKFQFAHLANLIQLVCDAKKKEFSTVKEFSNARSFVREARLEVKDLLDAEEDFRKASEEFKKPFKDLVDELNAKKEEEGVTDEKKAEIDAEVAKVTAEAQEKHTAQFKETGETLEAKSKEKVTMTMWENMYDVVKRLFNENGTQKFDTNVGPLEYGSDFLMDVDEALEKVEKFDA